MDPRQRNILIALSSLAGVGVVVLLVIVLSGGGSDSTVGTTTTSSIEVTSTTSSSTTTTVDLTALTTQPPAATTTSSTGPDAQPAPVLPADGAVLRRPAVADNRTLGAGCESLGDGAGWQVTCGTVDAGTVRLVWLTETRTIDGSLRAYVLRRLSGTTYTVALRMVDESAAGPETYSQITVRTADLSGSGTAEMVFGFRLAGSGGILALDLVESPGRVAAHADLDKGSARVSPGQMDTWSAEFGPSDPNCCPSVYRHRVVRWSQNRWRITLDEQVPPGSVPASQF